VALDNEPEDQEDDIAELLNFWITPLQAPYPHPDFQTTIKENTYSPDTLIIGDSFTRQLGRLFYPEIKQIVQAAWNWHSKYPTGYKD